MSPLELEIEDTVRIPSEGEYIFTAKTQKGDDIQIGAQKTDKENEDQEKPTGTYRLQKGIVDVAFFCRQKPRPKFLEISYEGPGIEKTVIPPEVLYNVPLK